MLFIFLGCSLFAQTRKIYIQIDTIIYNDKITFLDKFDLRINNKGFLNPSEIFDSTAKINLTSHPQYINTILIKNDSSSVDIPIDWNGSSISLLNIHSLIGDTLEIKKIQIYLTRCPDTSITRHAYWRTINGELCSEPYKVEYTTTTYDKIAPPSEIETNINGKSYKTTLTLDKRKWDGNASGHAYKPKNYIDKNGKLKKRTTYYHFTTIEKNYIWTGQIDIKNGT